MKKRPVRYCGRGGRQVKKAKKPLQGLNQRLASEFLQVTRSLYRNQREALEIELESAGDGGDHAAISHQKTLLSGLNKVELLKVRAIQQALDHVASGSYGVCAKCGNQILVARLRAVPWATLCLGCQEQSEYREHPKGQPKAVTVAEMFGDE